MPDAVLNGYPLHWEEAGRGRPLIMIHAALSSSRSFAAHLPALADHRRVLAIDLRGMGRSAHVPALPAGWVADLIALIEHVGAGPADLYGASLGGRLAMRTAIDRPDLVRSLILDHPIIAMDDATNASLSGSFSPAAIDERRARFYEEHHGDGWESVVATYLESRGLPEFQGFLNLREATKSIARRTLVIRGDRPDPAHPLLHAAEIAGNIRGAWLWIRPNTSAVRALDAGREEAYGLIERFLADVEG